MSSYVVGSTVNEETIAKVLDTVEAMLRAGTCSITYHRDIHEVPPNFSSRWKEYQTAPELKLSIRGNVPVDFTPRSDSSRGRLAHTSQKFIDRIVAGVERVLMSDVGRSRAGRIARTEVHRALLAGLYDQPYMRGIEYTSAPSESCMGVITPDGLSTLRKLPTLQEFVARYGGLWKNDQNPERHGLTGATATHMVIDDPNAGVQQEGAVVKVKKEKPRRFYVGKPGVMESTWAKGTLQEAVDQATAIVEQTGEEQVVVQVVRVVRRKPQPIVVEAVK